MGKKKYKFELDVQLTNGIHEIVFVEADSLKEAKALINESFGFGVLLIMEVSKEEL